MVFITASEAAKKEAVIMRQRGEKIMILHREDFVDEQVFRNLLSLAGCEPSEESQYRAVKVRFVKIEFIRKGT